MNRKDAREVAMKYIFQMEAQKNFSRESAENFIHEKDFGLQEEYVHNVIENIISNREQIDKNIDENSKGWPVKRMAKTDLAIIRLATAEILYLDDIPKSVAINEAVNLAKLYGTEQSPKFVNAVLKNIG